MPFGQRVGSSEAVSHIVRMASEDDWEVMRATRLQALAESPSSFGSTLAREQEFTEDVWRERARGSATTRLFLASDHEATVGIAGVFDEGDGSAQLVSVWVSPAHRGRGVARALTTAALDFAAQRGFSTIRLWVTEGNAIARALYEHLGFTPTGNRQPLPSDPALEEHELELRQSPAAGVARA
jgi:ribosomal protein S18 acetylase RimI-like enzyme